MDFNFKAAVPPTRCTPVRQSWQQKVWPQASMRGARLGSAAAKKVFRLAQTIQVAITVDVGYTARLVTSERWNLMCVGAT
jgi:hypothetical protein